MAVTPGVLPAVVGAGGVVAASAIGGGGNQGTATTGSNTPNVPSWMLPYLQQNASTASSLASQPYQPYTGTQVQPLSAMQNQAGTMSQNLANNGAAVSGMNAANAVQTNVANQGMNGLSQQTMANYMNPYTSSVINATNLKAQQQEQLQQNQLQAQEGATGAFGGSRASLAQGQLQSNFAQNMMANNATMNQNNFTNAENMGMQGLGQANTAAQGMMQSTAGAQTAQLQNIGALQTAGGLQQTTGQNQLNAQYQDYLTAQAYPYQQLQNSQNILNPIASLTTGTNATGFTEQTGSPSLAQQITGGATLGLAAENASSNSQNATSFANMFNSSNGNTTGLGTSSTASDENAINTSTSTGFSDTTSGGSNNAVSYAPSNVGGALSNNEGGMVGYAQGGQVNSGKPPSLSDHINHFIDGFAKQYLQGGVVGYKDGGQVETDIPGIPTQYGYKADTTPYTNQKPKYLIPAYAKGGKIPLQTGLPMADVAGIKRERQHWGKPYVPQTKNDPGYLRPDIKNALSTGGIAGVVDQGAYSGSAVPRYSNGGLTAHYDDEGAIAPSLALINADAGGGQQAIDNLLAGPSQAASSSPTLSSMTDAMQQGMGQASQNQNLGQYADASQLTPSLGTPQTSSDIGNALPANMLKPAPVPASVPATGPGAADPALAATDEADAKSEGIFKSLTGVSWKDLYGSTPGESRLSSFSKQATMAPIGASALLGGAAVEGTKGAYNYLAGASFNSPDEAKEALKSPATSSSDKQAAFQYLTAQADAAQKAQGMKLTVNKAPPSQTASTPASASSIPLSADVPASAEDEDVSTQIQKALLNKMLGNANGQGVNLPLLSMGAAILGNRSNSLAGAIGAGGEAYTKTKQAQNAQDLEALQRSTMLDYYSVRNKINQQNADQRGAKISAEIQKMHAASTTDPAAAAGMKAYTAALQNPTLDPEKEAIKARDTYNTLHGGASASQDAPVPYSPDLPSGTRYTWNGQTGTVP
jgi:hypothetical protein